jgi:flagellar assembly factor FliW
MKFAECATPQRLSDKTESVIRFPLGLLGFEAVKDYVLLAKPGDEPFLWLQVLNDPALAFLVLSPFSFVPTYEPDIAADDVAFLGLNAPEDALLFNIVTVRGAQQATLNLKGPIVLNRHTLVGKQVIPANAVEFSVQHPLPVATC